MVTVQSFEDMKWRPEEVELNDEMHKCKIDDLEAKVTEFTVIRETLGDQWRPLKTIGVHQELVLELLAEISKCFHDYSKLRINCPGNWQRPDKKSKIERNR